MQALIHPDYHQVVFRDRAAGLIFRTGSTLTSEKTIDFDGGVYPLIDVQISSASHPFWTGRDKIVDTEGRIERFNRRYGTGRFQKTDTAAKSTPATQADMQLTDVRASNQENEGDHR
ncbi:large subunit ribosomal protein L31 [Propionibacterium cyclohexanicum]|uniref:50S ribosomal protein L31 n=1 Tax=Propionibacterium cyclohexanicum TaxID=64702 RepID=A0A1H9SMV9_9ACTN|nr:large subunit ribosomal protein L31 [Propionibacterium cyclohexanicum]